MDYLGIALDATVSVAALLLAALGLYVTYGLMRVINMAHGDMMMLGAYTVWKLQSVGVNFVLAAASSALVLGLFGTLIERIVIRPLHGRGDLSTLLATWGLSLALVETVRLGYGPAGVSVDPPLEGTLVLTGTRISVHHLIILLFSTLVVLALWWLLHRTAAGLLVRATVENANVAESNRIDSRRVYSWGFAVGSALAGLAGAILAPVSAVTPTMGIDYVLPSFLVVIVGGFGVTTARRARFRRLALVVGKLGYIAAPVAGAVVVAGSRSLIDAFLGVTWATVGMFLVVLTCVFFRPNGIIAQP